MQKIKIVMKKKRSCGMHSPFIILFCTISNQIILNLTHLNPNFLYNIYIKRAWKESYMMLQKEKKYIHMKNEKEGK